MASRGEHLNHDCAMRRWFQFKLRTLLLATALTCACLGGWQIYSAHFAEFVEAETAEVGQPIRLTGRFSIKNGADSERFLIGVTPAGVPSLKPTKYVADRGRFGLYRFSETATNWGQSRWTEPGEYDLHVLLPNGGRYFSGHVSVKP